MRIIGGKDYYDGGAVYGIDPMVVFVRARDNEVSKDDFGVDNRFPGYHYRANEIPHGGRKWNISWRAIVFCGKFYGSVVVRGYKDHILSDDVVEKIFFTMEDYAAWRAEVGRPIKKSKFSIYCEHRENEHFLSNSALSDKEYQWVLDNRITVAFFPSRFAADGSVWSVNGDRLSETCFYRLFDVQAAHQEIAMWVGGTLSQPGPPMIEINDPKIKLAKHGFDKWSFRKKNG